MRMAELLGEEIGCELRIAERLGEEMVSELSKGSWKGGSHRLERGRRAKGKERGMENEGVRLKKATEAV